MNLLLLYFLKVNGLLIVFYFVYQFVLQKETFFQANRWFLIMGILISFGLPLLNYTKIVWIEPTLLPEINFKNSTAEAIENPIVRPTKIDWYTILISFYGLIILGFIGKLIIEFISFRNIVTKGSKTKENNIVWVENNTIESPFSFFNYLVYAQSGFTVDELHSIFIHEKVHITERHTFDVLVSKILTIILWINPIAWYYQKAILQNLEFIADNKTTQQINNTYAYQKTLLKSIIANHQLSITNQFYQSLIKKRIVMLNQQKSNKRNVWKYAIVLPVLIAFFSSFQIKTITQLKEPMPFFASELTPNLDFNALILSKTTDQELNEIQNQFLEENLKLKISKVKRNSNKEITSIRLEFKRNGKTEQEYNVNSNQPIDPFIVFYQSLEEGSDFGFKTTLDNSIAIGYDYAEIEEAKLQAEIAKQEAEEARREELLENVKEAVGEARNEAEMARQEAEEARREAMENAQKSRTEAEIERKKALEKREQALLEREKVLAEREVHIQTKKAIIIETEDGDQNILFNNNMLKMPGEPTIRIEKDNIDIYVNGIKLDNPESFLTMDSSKIYYMEVTEDEKNTNGSVTKSKRIDVKTK